MNNEFGGGRSIVNSTWVVSRDWGERGDLGIEDGLRD